MSESNYIGDGFTEEYDDGWPVDADPDEVEYDRLRTTYPDLPAYGEDKQVIEKRENRSVVELWEEYKQYRERYQNYYAGVHGDMLDFGQYLVLVDKFEDEMPGLYAQAEQMNPALVNDIDGGWHFIRNQEERDLWQRIADLENAMAL